MTRAVVVLRTLRGEWRCFNPKDWCIFNGHQINISTRPWPLTWVARSRLLITDTAEQPVTIK